MTTQKYFADSVAIQQFPPHEGRHDFVGLFATDEEFLIRACVPVGTALTSKACVCARVAFEDMSPRPTVPATGNFGTWSADSVSLASIDDPVRTEPLKHQGLFYTVRREGNNKILHFVVKIPNTGNASDPMWRLAYDPDLAPGGTVGGLFVQLKTLMFTDSVRWQTGQQFLNQVSSIEPKDFAKTLASSSRTGLTKMLANNPSTVTATTATAKIGTPLADASLADIDAATVTAFGAAATPDAQITVVMAGLDAGTITSVQAEALLKSSTEIKTGVPIGNVFAIMAESPTLFIAETALVICSGINLALLPHAQVSVGGAPTLQTGTGSEARVDLAKFDIMDPANVVTRSQDIMAFRYSRDTQAMLWILFKDGMTPIPTGETAFDVLTKQFADFVVPKFVKAMDELLEQDPKALPNRPYTIWASNPDAARILHSLFHIKENIFLTGRTPAHSRT